ncbi:hypothetical protein [Haloarcula litorea]|uniref:hypothetical protein n=1 Tax=Haloarcula litorea TaxID=3032579 RepID=UPI0023E767C9|nr:hypothetical protein [Halomicroarcula sp. GDY20]
MTDRPRGILSPADRAYLRGEADHGSEQAEYDARYRIRERVHHAMLDFALLFERLADADRRQVFAPDDAERDAFTEGVVNAVAFCYLGLADFDGSREALFEEGIRRAVQREHGGDGVCTVRIGVDRPTPARLRRIVEAVEAGAYHELDESDLRALACFLHRGERAPEDVLDRLKAALEET